MERAGLERLVRYFETLRPDGVRHLPEYYAADTYFKDPVNEVRRTRMRWGRFFSGCEGGRVRL